MVSGSSRSCEELRAACDVGSLPVLHALPPTSWKLKRCPQQEIPISLTRLAKRIICTSGDVCIQFTVHWWHPACSNHVIVLRTEGRDGSMKKKGPHEADVFRAEGR